MTSTNRFPARAISSLLALACLGGCAPAASRDTSNGSEIVSLDPKPSTFKAVTLSVSHPSETITHSCTAPTGLHCSTVVGYGVIPSQISPYIDSLPLEFSTTDDGYKSAGQYLFWSVQETGEKRGMGLIYDPDHFEYGGAFNEFDVALVEPGTHSIVLTRAPTLPADFPDLALHIMTNSKLYDCRGDDGNCRPAGPLPVCGLGGDVCDTSSDCCGGSPCTDKRCESESTPMATVTATLHSGRAGAVVTLASANGTEGEHRATSDTKGMVSFVDILVGDYLVLVGDKVVQGASITQGGAVALGTIAD